MADVAGIQIRSGFARKFSGGGDVGTKLDASQVAGSRDLEVVSSIAQGFSDLEVPTGVPREQQQQGSSVDVTSDGVPAQEERGTPA